MRGPVPALKAATPGTPVAPLGTVAPVVLLLEAVPVGTAATVYDLITGAATLASPASALLDSRAAASRVAPGTATSSVTLAAV